MKRWPTEPVAPSTPGQLLGRELGIVEGLRTALLLGEAGASVGEEAFGHCGCGVVEVESIRVNFFSYGSDCGESSARGPDPLRDTRYSTGQKHT
jgi:hypothetical protein